MHREVLPGLGGAPHWDHGTNGAGRGGNTTKRVLGTVARTLGEIGNEADVEDTKGDHVPYPSQKEKKKTF